MLLQRGLTFREIIRSLDYFVSFLRQGKNEKKDIPTHSIL